MLGLALSPTSVAVLSKAGLFPEAPAGFAYLVDEEGSFIVDENGAFLITEIA